MDRAVGVSRAGLGFIVPGCDVRMAQRVAIMLRVRIAAMPLPPHEEVAIPTAIGAPRASGGRLRRLFRSHLFLGLLAFAGFTFAILQLLDQLGGPHGIWERFGMFAPVVSMPLHAMVALTPVPSDLLAIANGAVYGFWLGAVLSWTGWWAAAMIQFWLARRLGRDWDVAGRMEMLPSWLRRFPVGHPAFLIGVRLLPVAGGHIGSIVPATMGVPAGRVAWCAALAILPGAFLSAAIGVGLMRL